MGFLRKWRIKRYMKAPFPPEWRPILDTCVPYTRRLNDSQRVRLEALIMAFLADKTFEGFGGLEITDNIRLNIAAQACLLELNRDTQLFPLLKSILVYPTSYTVTRQRRNPDGTVSMVPERRAGESWNRGQVVLSWSDARHGAQNTEDGLNVVFHEFAHQLDSEDGAMDGAPDLSRMQRYRVWADVLSREYQQLLDDLENGRETFIRAYGALNAPEFFAVITEAFFEQPATLKRKHPDLYEQLKEFYRQDPA